MKIIFIILGMWVIAIFAIAHSAVVEKQKADFMKFCHDRHIAEVGNVVFLKFEHIYTAQCEDTWRYRQ